MDKSEVSTRLTESRQALLTAIAGLSEEELTGPKVDGIWTVKDLLGHIAAWEGTLLKPLADYAVGEPFIAQVILDHDAWNAEQAARRSSSSVLELQLELNSIRQDLLEAFEKLSDAQLTKTFLAPWGEKNTILEMLSGLAWHEEEHTKSILKKFPQ